MRLTPVYFICSPRPYVGKTVLARQLTEFLELFRGTVAAFDINLKEPSLVDFLPRLTETADVIDTRAQMALMDRLIVNDGEAKVIDIGFHAFDDFFRMITEIGFFKEAARQGIRPLVIYAPDTDRVSTRGYEDICRKVPYDSLMVLDNEFVLRGPLPEIYSHGYSLYIRALPMFLKTYIDRTDFSFISYLRQERDPSTELHQWIRANFNRFRDLETQLMR